MAFSFFSTGTTSEVNFIPEVFSKLLQAKFYSASVLPSISNTDYEGEISGQGDKVTIRTVPAVTINDYAGAITTQELTTAKVELLIDQAKYYSFKIDDVLAAQADINIWPALLHWQLDTSLRVAQSIGIKSVAPRKHCHP